MGYWSFLDTGLVPCIIPGCFGRRRGKRTRFGGFFYVWWLPVFPGCQAGQAAGLSSICWVNYTQQCLSGCGGREQRPEVTTTTFKSFAAYRPAGGTFLNNRCRVSALLMDINLDNSNFAVNIKLDKTNKMSDKKPNIMKTLG